MKVINVTQGINGGYSHKGTDAIDNAGKDTGIDSVYAPYTGKVVQINYNSNAVFFESVDIVKCADGDECFVTTKFVHDNDITDLYLGKIINQGVKFYDEGTKGNATGNHIEISVAKGKNQGYVQNSYGNWILKGSIAPYKIFFVGTNTIILDGESYPWIKTDTTTYKSTVAPSIIGSPVERNTTVDQIEVIIDNLRGRTAPTTNDGNNIVGLMKKGIYNVLDKSNDNVYVWYKIEPSLWCASKDGWIKFYSKEEVPVIVDS